MEEKEITHDDNSKSKNQKKDTYPPARLPVCPIGKEDGSQRQAYRTSKNRKNKFFNWIRRKKNHSFILMCVNIIMLLAFILFSWWQGCQTRRGIELADAANINTQRSLEMTDSAIKMELRAYVGISRPNNIIIKSNDLGLELVKINTGKTPAYIFYGIGIYDVGIKNLSNSIEKYMKFNSIDLQNFTQFNEFGDTVSVETNPGFTDRQIKNIYSGIDTLFICTYFKYRDVFLDTHYTMQCYYSRIGTGKNLIFTRYKDYNDGN